MALIKHNYATLSAPGTKKVSVCARRVGSRNRMAVIAVCAEEGNAEKIVDALNHMQGEITKLETPAQRVLEEVRSVLVKERALMDELRRDKRLLETKFSDTQRELDRCKEDLRRVRLERDAAQKAALEKA